MSAPGQKDKFTPELRILVASLLSFAVIILWAKFFGPKPSLQPTQANRPVQSAPAPPGPATSPAANPSQATATPATIAPPTAVSVTVKNDSQERLVVVENSLYRVEISNRGAVVKSWQLKNYKDDAKPQRMLDVVHSDASEQTGGWPFSVVLDDEQLQNAANGGLYQLSSPEIALQAPADVEFTWSDGRLEVTKHFRFDHTYVVRVETSVKLNGRRNTAGLGRVCGLGGFGDLTVTNPAPVETVLTYYSEGGKITSYPHKKLDGIEKWGPGVWQGGKDFVGIEDRYFTAAFLPANGAAPGTLATRYWKSWRNVKVNGQDTAEPVPQAAAAASTQTPAFGVD